MKHPSRLLKIVTPVLALAVFNSACENMTPGENAAVFGGLTAAAVGIPLAVAGVDPAITIPVTIGATALAAGATYIIAKHQATERQRKIAEQRAKIYLAKREAAEKEAAKKAAQTASKPKAAKQPRYIAVNTEKSGASQSSGPSVMIYDTQSEQIVGNNVYDLKSKPKAGETSKFDTYTAQYVGNGTVVQ